MQLKGECRALFAFGVGREIDLALAEGRLGGASQRVTWRHKRTGPLPAGRGTAPLRVARETPRREVAGLACEPQAELSLHEFGALCVTFALPLDVDVETAIRLSSELYDHVELRADARRLAQELLREIERAVEAPAEPDLVEDHVLFLVAPGDPPPPELLQRRGPVLARLLRAETGTLSPQEVEAALAFNVSYGPCDLTVVDWFASLVVGADTEDESLLIELANAELAALRHLDRRLRDDLDLAYATLSAPPGPLARLSSRSRELARIAALQTDAAHLFAGADNAHELFGDDYLARLYEQASRAFQFPAWDASIERRIAGLESVYQKHSDQANHRRSELLEWIIIALIAADIALVLMASR